MENLASERNQRVVSDKMESMSIKSFLEYKDIEKQPENKIVTLNGFLSNLRSKGKRGFLVLRSRLDTVQFVFSRVEGEPTSLDNDSFSILCKTPLESFIEVEGLVKSTDFEIKHCSISRKEILVTRFSIVSLAKSLAFALKDASASEKEREEKNLSIVSYNKCLDNRSLDLRTSHSYSIFRVLDNTMHYFRDFLRKRNFLEIKTSKLIEAASEGGANCFKVDFFGKQAFLAQSPQLYKQMAIIGGMRKVYEIGHVYRAEVSNINRYLSEFTGMDIEMEINQSYKEVYVLVYDLIIYIFDSIKESCKEELEIIRKFKHFEDVKYSRLPIVFTYTECIDMLKNENFPIAHGQDFSREAEKRLGCIVKDKFNVDIFIIKDYPLKVRAFYTKRSDIDENLTNSYDFILRGEEILSGAQRINDYYELLESVKHFGINQETVKGYLESFKNGAPLHGGVGIGLERMMKSYFGFNDIRYFNMFPRDPSRLYP